MDMKKYLENSEYIDFLENNIQFLAKKLANGCLNDEEIAKKCFLYVRDEIKHIGDYKLDFKSVKASEVLKNKAGWCYAKSHLLAALLRANLIPTGLCYQHLSCGEYKENIFCLHGLNAIYLKKYGWYKVDARGNKEGINADFTPPKEKLAFELGENEYDIEGIFDKPLDIVIEKLNKNDSYEKMMGDFPSINQMLLNMENKY